MTPVLCPRCGLNRPAPHAGGLCSSCHADESLSTATGSVASSGPVTTATRPNSAAVTPAFDDRPAARGLPPCAGYRFAESDLLGEGGMGRVYKAVQVSSGMTVAVKLLQADAAPALLRRFAGEAASLARLRHPNVVGLHDFVRDTPDPFLVMEYVDGQPLSRYAEERKPDPREAARLVAAAARGVHAAHQQGVFHRDLKPSNLLRAADGGVKVADFGLSKQADHADTVTQTGHLAGGTPGFMAPEQADPAADGCDARTDVWGLGATLYALLVGRPPFPTGSKNALKVLSEPYLPPRQVNRNVPRELDAIVNKCLERERANRYPSAATLADDLDHWLSGRPTTARPVGWLGRQWKRVRRTPRATVAAWAMAAVAVAMVGLVTQARPPRTVTPTDPPKVDELTRLQDLFRKGEVVTLVPKAGLPKWSEWVVRRSEIGQLPNGTGAAHIQPINQGVVLLFPNPEPPYRVQAELRHVSAADLRNTSATQVGLVFAHQRTRTQDGAVVESFLSVVFCDYDRGPFRREPPQPELVEVWSYHYHFDQLGASPFQSKARVAPTDVVFDPPPLPPGMWRQVIVEVSADGVKVFWRPDAEDKSRDPVEVLTRTTEHIDARLRTQQFSLANAAEAPKIAQDFPTTWRPEGGVGVWASNSGLEFRNLTVQRTPPTPR